MRKPNWLCLCDTKAMFVPWLIFSILLPVIVVYGYDAIWGIGPA